MAWKDIETDSSVTEGSKGAFRLLGTKEVAHVEVERTDGGTTDGMIVRTFASLDGGSTTPDVPIMDLLVARTDTRIAFTVNGFYSYAIEIDNTGSTDSITADIRHRLDNGLTA